MPGAEFSLIARASSSVITGLAKNITAQQEWPNIHAALVELHEILSEWAAAAGRTQYLIHESQGLTPKQIREAYKFVNVYVHPILRNGYIEAAERDLADVMSPPASIFHRWSSRKRRKSARRTLFSVLRIYCPDLLDEYEKAIADRKSWVHCNRKEIKRRVEELTAHERAVLGTQGMQSCAQLEAVRQQVELLIRERFPLGGAEPRGN
ncbi:hypothetical protein [Streptomyces halstedii]|uniref:Uncharacterized protein n=1 Tax=Streptomyces halstedii TaxID=1944 RepID=A0A6N9UE07_STRHA|nr:hypothetical protein [Streptomyces halstedii]NEA19185.1 hypothetical protein [Streptomyces halstedii]